MPLLIPRDILIQSLTQFGKELQAPPLNPQTLQAALSANPWFTPYYIYTSIQSIRKWMQPEALTRFLAAYPARSEEAKRVGMIAAGNIPMVGFHDVLMTLLAGHIAVVKCSRQDTVMMKWMLELWVRILPDLASWIEFVEAPTSLDYLIATGSNNTARHLDVQFAGVSRTMRGHRSSVAVIDRPLSPQEIHQLSHDILLYNGLGCRNVSLLFLTPEANFSEITYLLSDRKSEQINPLYLEKVKRERARMHTLGQEFEDLGNLLIQRVNTFIWPNMGVLNVFFVDSRAEALEIIETNSSQIQCVVNHGIDFGESQYPDVDEFADNVNIFEILTHI